MTGIKKLLLQTEKIYTKDRKGVAMYQIKKVLNSSVVLVEDDTNAEFVLLGKGIGFGKKPGQVVGEESVSQVFIPVDDAKIQEYIDIVNQLIKKAEEQLQLKLTPTSYFALVDHLQFAVVRYHDQLMFTNKVFWEIKTYYRQEYQLGELGVKLLNEQFAIDIPEEEAANIAFHFINAQMNAKSFKGMEAAKLISSIVNLVGYSLGVDLVHQNIHHTRLVTHIKFFVERYFQDQMLDSKDTEMFEYVANRYPKALAVAYQVNEFVKKKYQKPMTNDELLYLAIHFNRILQ